MSILSSFTFISLNGYYKDINGEIQWHQHGGEEAEYSAESLKKGNILLFGRVTYELMKNFWQTEMAYNLFPETAGGMNKSEKIVVTKSLTTADWDNTLIINKDLIENIKNLKQNSKKDITILGSGSILKQLSEANLIDEYQIMVDPVFIKNGKSILDNLNKNINLSLKNSRVFKSGVILLIYGPAEK